MSDFQMWEESEVNKLIKRINYLENKIEQLTGKLPIQTRLYRDDCVQYPEAKVKIAIIDTYHCAKNHCRYLIDRSSNGDYRHWCNLFHRDIIEEFRLSECIESEVK